MRSLAPIGTIPLCSAPFERTFPALVPIAMPALGLEARWRSAPVVLARAMDDGRLLGRWLSEPAIDGRRVRVVQG